MAGPSPADAPLLLRTLGAAALGAPATTLLPPGKPLALIAYLALAPRRTSTRDHLLDLLWGDLEPEKARHALRQTLWYLRQLLGAESLTASRGGEITLALPLTADRDQFLAALDAGDLERAVALYEGSFLGEFAVPGGVEFEHWADVERQRLRAAFLRAAETLTRRHLAAGQYREAQQLARRARDQARNNEALWRLLLEAYAQAGDQLGFAMEASSLSVMLAGDGREPEPATRALLRRLESEDRPVAAGDESHGLAPELVGREREFAMLVQCWRGIVGGGGRHVHVSAPPGIGKTRLLDDLRDRLRGLGARVVGARANPGEGGISYAFVAHLATQLARLPGAAAVSPATAGTLVALSPTLSSRYSASPDPATGDEALRRRAAALSELLTVVSDERPLALLLDDMHWLDPASRHALRSVLERIGDSQALVVTASRFSGPASVMVASSTELPLEPLSPLQVRALVGSLGTVPGDPWGRGLPDALSRATGGSPLLILGTLQLALEEGWLELVDGTWACPDPALLGRRLQEGSALRHRAAQLDDDGRRLLLALAIAGTPLPASMLSAATGLTLGRAAGSLFALEQRGFLLRSGDTFQPSHDEIAAASRELADAETVAEIHARLGRALAAFRHADLSELVRAGHHLILAGQSDEATGVFTRYLTRLRRQGDGRRVAAIAYEFLGEGTPLPAVETLLRGIPLWTRLRRSSARSAIGFAGVAVLLGGGALYSAANRPEPPLSIIAIESDAEGRLNLATAQVGQESWNSAEPLQLSEASEGLLPMRLPAQFVERSNGLVPSPDFRTIAYQLAIPAAQDSGVIDIFIANRQRHRRLTTEPRDDGPLDWSPDGRQLVSYSARWSPPGLDDYDLALVDTATGALTRLTHTRDADYNGFWSPDGQRIGFVRVWKEADRGNSFCWITPVAGQEPVCIEPRGAELVGLAGGWLDDEHVPVYVDSAALKLAALLNVGTGEWSRLPYSTVRSARVAPGSAFLLLEGTRAGGKEREWLMAPVGQLRAARTLKPSRPGRLIHEVHWRAAGPATGYLDTLLITNPPAEIAVGTTARLEIMGRDPVGTPIPIRTQPRWTSSNAAVLTVDQTGMVRGIAPGEVWITAALPGWRAVRHRIRVTGGGPRTVLEESWDAAWQARWIAQGFPKPRIETGPDGRRGLLNNGDGSYSSGALSREGWDPSGGLGLELQVSTPVNHAQLQFQQLSVYFQHPIRPDFDTPFDTASMGFEALLGNPPGSSCGFQYPAHEGRLGARRLAMTGTGGRSSPTVVGPWIWSGAWWTVRIQMLPDGRCGVAVNGVPIWLSDEGTKLDMRWRITLGTSSKNARILHGPLEVWQGVRQDIDWSVLDSLKGRPLPLAVEPGRQ